MRDWQKYVRQNFEIADEKGHLETEIVEEIASQLHDCYLGALTRGASEERADAEARSHITDWTTLAADIAGSKRNLATSRADLRIERFAQQASVHAFIPSDYVLVHDALRSLAARSVAPGNAF